jgi:hypothetical protein
MKLSTTAPAAAGSVLLRDPRAVRAAVERALFYY